MHGDIHLYIDSHNASLSSDERLIRCARAYMCDNSISGNDFTIRRTERGKPFFPGLDAVHCSISHSGNYWVCAMARQIVGVDIQEHVTADTTAIANRFFHPAEAAYVIANDIDAFFSVWTAKESYVKCTGEGLTEAFGQFTVVAEGALNNKVEEMTFRHIRYTHGYSLCLCAPLIDSIVMPLSIF